jgi:subtilisin family serine protease
MRSLLLVSGLAWVLALGTGPQARTAPELPHRLQVVVLLTAPPIAKATAPKASAAARIAAEQRRFRRALAEAVPAASVRWRYRLVANGLAVVVPRESIGRLRSLPAVRDVLTGITYTPSMGHRARQARGPATWAPGLTNTGEGMKIGIIDDGVDQRHQFFAPAGYEMPPGYPKGQKPYTTAKVIVARAFPPPTARSKSAAKPFDARSSEHGTHVAGIAAGNARTPASDNRRISGVAPRAYIGNYKALTVPTDANVGLDGNAAEIVAAIEAAVADGMDVINLSIGEPEIEPSRDLVALALDAAAEMGVVSVVAAGNDFQSFGRGSVSSPGTAAKAITVAAVTAGEGSEAGSPAGFSSAGPSPLSLRLKPDVSAPGVDILSSTPGGWATMSGTSMAAPHVAGAAALLLERHPEWTTEQVKAALVGSAEPARESRSSAALAVPTRGGSGVVDLLRADQPLVLATPASVSFGLVRPGAPVQEATVALADAGLGAGSWTVTVETRLAPVGAALSTPPAVEVPGSLVLAPVVSETAANGEMTGWVTLTRGTDVRRIPFWLRVAHPLLGGSASTPLARPGTYAGNTRGRPARVSSYRYPELPRAADVSSVLAGPEQVFRVTLAAPVANFGVVVTGRSKGVRVEPRVVAAGDENRLTGYAALPLNLNPYLAQFGVPVPAAGAVRPVAGLYDVVFDSPGGGAGRFTFRYWVNDVTPPRAALRSRHVPHGEPVRVRVSDTGSGIDAATVKVSIGKTAPRPRIGAGVVSIPTSGLGRGSHTLRLQVSDYQESRNTENVPPILPNTRVLTTTIVIV